MDELDAILNEAAAIDLDAELDLFAQSVEASSCAFVLPSALFFLPRSSPPLQVPDIL